MAILNILGHSVEVDIEEELRDYDFGYQSRQSADKIIASSPFRTDKAPSFFVNLSGEYAGTWGDSGAIDEDYSRGNFIKLIALLNEYSYEEAGDYLIEKYGVLYPKSPSDTIRIRAPRLEVKQVKRSSLDEDIVTQATSPYLTTRGISAEVQRKFSIGYGEDIPGYTAFPWYDTSGRLANVKYRSTRDKKFFYEKGATPVNSLVYGLDFFAGKAGEGDVNEAVICEGEIDVLSWGTAGISAIALGGAHMSHEQADLIKRSRLRRIYLGGDNDKQGANMNEQIAKMLGGYVEMMKVNYGAHNDANDVLLAEGTEGLEEVTTKAAHGNRLHLCNINVI